MTTKRLGGDGEHGHPTAPVDDIVSAKELQDNVGGSIPAVKRRRHKHRSDSSIFVVEVKASKKKTILDNWKRNPRYRVVEAASNVGTRMAAQALQELGSQLDAIRTVRESLVGEPASSRLDIKSIIGEPGDHLAEIDAILAKGRSDGRN